MAASRLVRSSMFAALSVLLLLHLAYDPSMHWRKPQSLPTRRRALQTAAADGAGWLVAKGFAHEKVVAVLASERFEIFEAAMSALQEAVGAGEYTVLISIDGSGTPDRQRILDLARQLKTLAQRGTGFKRAQLLVSSTHLGAGAARRLLAETAFSVSDFVVLLGGNVVLAPDALRWFEWHASSGFIFQNPHVATASCWSPSFPADSPSGSSQLAAADELAVRQLGLLDKLVLDSWTQPFGLALWRSTWHAVGPAWDGGDQQLAQLLQAKGLVQSLPMVPRCNILESSSSGSSSGGSSSSGSSGSSSGGSSGDNEPTPAQQQQQEQPAEPQVVMHRSLTSADFLPAELGGCASFTLLPRHSATEPLHAFLLYDAGYVRYGITPDGRLADVPLPELQKLMHQFMRWQPNPDLWLSSC